MNLTRAKELPIESRGETNPVPGSVKDWQSDRLAAALVQVERVFEQALATRLETPSENSSMLTSIQATLKDIGVAAQNSPNTAKEFTESVERILENYTVHDTLPKVISNELQYPEIAAEITRIASRELAQNSFYGVTQDACSSDAKLETMCDRAHAMVKAGYIGEDDLAGLRVALTDSESPRSKASEAFRDIALVAGAKQYQFVAEPNRSWFSDNAAKFQPDAIATQPTVFVDKQEAKSIFGMYPDAVEKVFSHEMGHWLGRDKLPQMISAGVDAVKVAGGADAAHLDKFFKTKDMEPGGSSVLASDKGGLITRELRPLDFGMTDATNPELAKIRVSWAAVGNEMQGDLMSIAAENAFKGKEAALEMAGTLIKLRDERQVGGLVELTELLQNGADPHRIRFGEEHYTTAAIRDFAERVQAGALDNVKTPQQLERLMGESIVRGLVNEYVLVRGAELNIHHVENGRAVPGVPPGVDLKAVLAAEMENKIPHIPGTPTFLLTEKPPQALFNNAPGVALEVTSPDGGVGQSFWLTTKAPGVSAPDASMESKKFYGQEMAGTMVALAKDTLAASAGHELPSPASAVTGAAVDSTKLPQVAEPGQAAKQTAPQAEAAQPAPAMSM